MMHSGYYWPTVVSYIKPHQSDLPSPPHLFFFSVSKNSPRQTRNDVRALIRVRGSESE